MALITEPIDLLLDSDGDLVVGTDLSLSSGLAAIVQGVRIRTQTFRGEWFLDLDHGVPWFTDILGQKYNEIRVRAAFRDAILDTPGIASLTSLRVDFSAGTRLLTVAWEAKSEFGDTVSDTLSTTGAA